MRVWPIILMLCVAASTRGGAFQETAAGTQVKRTSLQRLVRPRVGLPATLRRSLARYDGQQGGVPGDSGDMSVMGRLARLSASGQLERLIEKSHGDGEHWDPIEALPAGGNTPPGGDPQDDGPSVAPGGQAELSLAVDSSGQHIVVGMNDTRGFGLPAISVSGYAYSDDGGATFVDGGQLPTGAVPPATLPQVFGDPEVKYLGGSTFIYFSIMLKRIGTSGIAQTMCLHRSTDFGHTWQGPFEIPSATNPHGALSGGNARDSADKEFADVDPETGRVLMSWSNFTPFAPGGVEIATTYSTDVMTATPPTWTIYKVVANAIFDGQASIPRFAAGSSNAYVAWRRNDFNSTNNVGFARSVDNGATWSPPVNLTTSFFTVDQILGNDRINTSPSLAIDNSGGSASGNLYVVYANNSSHDGADIMFQRSTDGGLTFSPAVALNSRPGFDRAQWFPWVTVDKNTGRVSVFYYDQGIRLNGDLTETTFLYSDDAGVTWSKPTPLSDRPFHAGYGNDTGQPNIGDYNQAVAQNGELFAVWGGNPNAVGFADGQPTSSFTVPDVYFKRIATRGAALRLGPVTATDSGGNGFMDAGEHVTLTLPVGNYVTNPASAGAITGITGLLTTPTLGVTVTQASSTYGVAAPATTVPNATSYEIALAPNFTPGTHIELVLNISSSDGSTTLLHTLSTGTPLSRVLFSENFDGVTPPALPAGWGTLHAGGANTVPWITNSTFNPGNNGAFHANANDGVGGTGNPTRFERLATPNITIPANSEYVTVDFDTKYDTEDEPLFNIWAYDGFSLRVTDFTPGRFARANLVEAFAEEFTTGSFEHFPKHLPRSNNTNYFQDMSVWAGDSGGMQHVHLKLPGMAGSVVQLRFEYTQDGSAICANVRPGHSCGVLFDNLVVKSVVSTQADLSIAKAAAPEPVVSGSNLTYTLVARNNGTDPARNTAGGVTVSDVIPAGTTFVSSTTPAGWTCGVSSGTFSCTKPAMAPGETAAFTLVVAVNCATPDGTVLSNTATIGSAITPDPDHGNNSSTALTTVSNPPPSITGASASVSELGPPNHRLVDVTIDYATSDNCGSITTSLSVTSSEPEDGLGDGDTESDSVVVDDHHVKLRAERSGSGSGRIYTITITATDSGGGTSTQTVVVTVPH